MRGGAFGVARDYGPERKKTKRDLYNEQVFKEWRDKGARNEERPWAVSRAPSWWKPGMPSVKPPQKPRGKKKAASDPYNLPPGFAGLPLSKKMKGPYQGDHFKRRPPKKQTKKGLTLPPGIAFRSTKAAKASLFQPKGLPAPAAALPKIQPKALPKYRAAKAAKAKTPRKKAAPKAPKCVNGVVHVKAYTRKCSAKKQAAQVGKGIGSKLKTAAKIAGAAALASLAYKNRDVLKDIPRTYDAFKRVHRGHPLNTHPRIHAAKLTAMDTLKNLKIPGRGIGSKLKTAAKVTGAAALAAGLALLARHKPHLTGNIKPVSRTQGSLYFPNASPWGPTY